MASLVPENWTSLNNEMDMDIQGIQIQDSNGSLLKNLLEDTQVEDCNEERLKSLMQSLEAEINSHAYDDGHGGNSSVMEVEPVHDKGSFQSWDAGYSTTSQVSLDTAIRFIEREMASPFPSDGMANWCLDLFEEKGNQYVPQEYLYDAYINN